MRILNVVTVWKWKKYVTQLDKFVPSRNVFSQIIVINRLTEY